MKIWKSFAADHTSDYRIIAVFPDKKKAYTAVDVFNQLLAVDNKYPDPGVKYAHPIYAILDKYKIASFSSTDPIDLIPFKPLKCNGIEVKLDTDEYNIQALVKILLHFDAKLEITKREKKRVYGSDDDII